MASYLPVKGIHTDNDPMVQPEGFSRFMLNAIIKNGVVQNDNGNERIAFNEGQSLEGTPIGSITLDANRSIVFSYTISSIDGNTTSYVSLFDKRTGDHSLIIQSVLFNFRPDHPITGVYRKIGCEEYIFWVDGFNPDRFLNITNTKEHLGPQGPNADQFNELKTRQHRPSQIHELELNELFSSGSIEYGTYGFNIEYVDKQNNVLYRTDILNYINIAEYRNIDTVSSSVGGKLPKSSSIELIINRLDTNFDYFKINIFRYTSDNGITIQTGKLNQVFRVNNKTTFKYIYTGIELLEPITFEEGLIPIPYYQRSRVISQVQNRLVKANLKEPYIDYSRYQQFASKIKTTWTTKPASNVEFIRTWASGEVIPLGIRYIHEGGRKSPVFHIPGRNSQPRDLEDVTVNGTVYKRYEIDSTFTIISTTPEPITIANKGYRQFGELGYYQSDQLYSNPANYCSASIDDDSYWGEDFDGLELLNRNVRYSKLPTIRDIHIDDGLDYTDNDKLIYQPIFLNFSNIEYPSDDIIGHEFVYSDVEKTIEERGYLSEYFHKDLETDLNGIDTNFKDRYYRQFLNIRNVSNTANPTGEGLLDPNHGVYQFITLERKFNDLKVDNLLFRVEGRLIEGGRIPYSLDYDNYYHDDLNYDDLELRILANNLRNLVSLNEGSLYDVFGSTANLVLNLDDLIFPIYETRTLRPASLDSDFINTSMNAEKSICISKLNTDCRLFDPENVVKPVLYGYFLNKTKVYQDIWSIEYKPLYRKFTKPNNSLENNVVLGNKFLSHTSFTSISSTEFKSDIDFNSLFIPVIGPAVFVAKLFKDNDAEVKLSSTYIHRLFFESDINASWRISVDHSISSCVKYKQHSFNNISAISTYILTLINEQVKIGDKEGFKIRDSICEEEFIVNKDLLQTHFFDFSNSIPFTLNLCTDCANEYPTDIIWSDFSSFESNNFLTFKTINRKSISNIKGGITGLNETNKYVIVRTELSCYILQVNPQELITNETTLVLGTGAFMGYPEREVIIDDLGYGGQTHPINFIQTPFGLVWADLIYGKLFIWKDGLKELTAISGNSFLFRRIFKTDQPYWTHFGYDYYNHRLFVTCTSLNILDEDWELLSPSLIINRDTNAFGIANASSSKDLLENRSFTASFDIQGRSGQMSLMSFHSNIPYHYISKPECYFTYTNRTMYIHRDIDFGFINTINNRQYPFIVEQIQKTESGISRLKSLLYHSEVFDIKNSDNSFSDKLDKTFTEAIIYNQDYSTGLQKLVLLDDNNTTIGYNPREKYVTEVDDLYKISLIRSLVENNKAFWSEDWSDIQSIVDSTGNGYIDKLPININYDTEQNNLKHLVGYWFISRLIYDDKVAGNKHIRVKFLMNRETPNSL